MDNNKKRIKSDSLRNFLAGLVIGLGGILPGVSGGIMAVSFGLYRPILDAITGFFSSPKKNFVFLLPIGIGVGAGMFTGSFFLSEFFERFYVQVMMMFLGLVLGGIPSLIKEANKDGFKARWLGAAVFGMGLGALLLLMQNEASNVSALGTISFLEAFFTGFIIVSGVFMPGISISFILIFLGWYYPAMRAIVSINIPLLLFMALGGGVGVLITGLFMRFIFNRFRGWAYYGVLGFLLVSAVLIFPGFALDTAHFVGIVLFALGFILALQFDKLGDKK